MRSPAQPSLTFSVLSCQSESNSITACTSKLVEEVGMVALLPELLWKSCKRDTVQYAR